MPVLKQLLKEFWMPFTISTVWVSFNVFGGKSSDSWDVASVINVFGPTFFLISWLTGQFFRVKKQKNVEENLLSIEKRAEELLSQLEAHTKEIVKVSTGESSIPLFVLNGLIHSPNTSLVRNMGDYPLYNVTALIRDYKEFQKIREGNEPGSLSKCDTHLDVGEIAPGAMKKVPGFVATPKFENSYKIFISTRSGHLHQQVRIKKVSDKYLTAVRVENLDGEVLLEEAQEGYPKDELGNVEWLPAEAWMG